MIVSKLYLIICMHFKLLGSTLFSRLPFFGWLDLLNLFQNIVMPVGATLVLVNFLFFFYKHKFDKHTYIWKIMMNTTLTFYIQVVFVFHDDFDTWTGLPVWHRWSNLYCSYWWGLNVLLKMIPYTEIHFLGLERTIYYKNKFCIRSQIVKLELDGLWY